MLSMKLSSVRLPFLLAGVCGPGEFCHLKQKTFLSAVSPPNFDPPMYDNDTVHFSTEVEIKGNATEGSIRTHYYRQCTVKLGKITFDSNYAFGSFGSPGNGGAIFLSIGQLFANKKVTFTKNQAIVGGAICAQNADVCLSNADFEENAAQKFGGAVYLEGTQGNFIQKGGIFEQNNARESGGAVTACFLSSFYLESVTIKNNTARMNGGGLEIESTPANLFSCKFLLNQAGGSYINKNYSDERFLKRGGGAIYFVTCKEIYTQFNLYTQSCCFDRNKALIFEKYATAGFNVLLQNHVGWSSFGDTIHGGEYSVGKTPNVSVTFYYSPISSANCSGMETETKTEKISTTSTKTPLSPSKSDNQGTSYVPSPTDYTFVASPITKLPQRTANKYSSYTLLSVLATLTPFQTLEASPKSTIDPTLKETPFSSPINTPLETPFSSPLETPYSSPIETLIETPFSSPLITPFSSPLGTPNDSPHDTLTQTPLNTPDKSPNESPVESPYASLIETPSSSFVETAFSSPAETQNPTPFISPFSSPADSFWPSPTQTLIATQGPSPLPSPIFTPNFSPYSSPKHTPNSSPFDTPPSTIAKTLSPSLTPTVVPSMSPKSGFIFSELETKIETSFSTNIIASTFVSYTEVTTIGSDGEISITAFSNTVIEIQIVSYYVGYSSYFTLTLIESQDGSDVRDSLSSTTIILIATGIIIVLFVVTGVGVYLYRKSTNETTSLGSISEESEVHDGQVILSKNIISEFNTTEIPETETEGGDNVIVANQEDEDFMNNLDF